MAGQAGKDMLLKLSDGATTPTFHTVAGLRARTITLNAQVVDATSADSPGRWRELLAGAGVRTCSVSGAGLFKDAASDAQVRASFFAGDARVWRLVVPDFGTLEGPFQIASLEYAGAHDGEATFAITLASAGELTFAAL
jgi:TP901-1 family phage major tail protein